MCRLTRWVSALRLASARMRRTASASQVRSAGFCGWTSRRGWTIESGGMADSEMGGSAVGGRRGVGVHANLAPGPGHPRGWRMRGDRGVTGPSLAGHARPMTRASEDHRLILLRHARAEQGAGTPDHQRELAKRGRRDAKAAGVWLAGHEIGFDLVLVSSSARTMQ